MIHEPVARLVLRHRFFVGSASGGCPGLFSRCLPDKNAEEFVFLCGVGEQYHLCSVEQAHEPDPSGTEDR